MFIKLSHVIAHDVRLIYLLMGKSFLYSEDDADFVDINWTFSRAISKNFK